MFEEVGIEEERGRTDIQDSTESRRFPRTRGTSYITSKKSIPQKRSVPVEPSQSSSGRTQPERRSKKVHGNVVGDPVEESMRPLTEDERRHWKGWVELESDPALFNFILREYGVKDVKVQEVLGLDDQMLSFLPKPVFGLVFLFKYREEDDETKTENAFQCPRNVWFANQTTNNACATVALLNIVMNVPEINLGGAMASFKQTTQGLKPAFRGQRLSQDESIRCVHNSFARRMDMLNADLALQNEFEKWEKSKNPKRRRNSTSKRKKNEEESGFHFVAYVPINGSVWRLDGLQPQPINLGASGNDWITVARDNITARMMQYEQDGVQFNLLSLCGSPLREIRHRLATNLHLLKSTEEDLDNLVPDWKAFTDGARTFQNAQIFDLSPECIDNVVHPPSAIQGVQDASNDPASLLKLHQDLLKKHAALRSSYLEEVVSVRQENEQASRRKHDHTPRIYGAMKKLAEAGSLKEVVLDVRTREGINT